LIIFEEKVAPQILSQRPKTKDGTTVSRAKVRIKEEKAKKGKRKGLIILLAVMIFMTQQKIGTS
jgi:hypothetical protein